MNKKWMKLGFRISLIGLIALLGTACLPNLGQLVPPTPPVQTGQVPATGHTPSVSVNDQEYDGAQVVVAEVVSSGPGWMVIHSQENGAVGPPIGYAPVNDGENKNVVVKIDPAQTTPELYAMLHADAGKVGQYEFPGPDVPISVNGQMITPGFKAMKHDENANITPAVVVKNQVVNQGKVIVSEVDSPGPGWIAIHIQNPDGTPGNDIGFVAVKAGKNMNIQVTVDPSKVTPVMYAMLHKDGGEIGTYEFPGTDNPIEQSGAMIAPSFATNTSDPSVSTTGNAGTPIAMNMGETTATSGPPATAAAKPAPADTVAPAGTAVPTATALPPTQTPKPPVAAPTATQAAMNMGMNPSPTPNAKPAGSTPEGGTAFIKTADQPIVDAKVIIPEVYSVGNAWLVIHRQNGDGTMGGMVGYAKVRKGDNRNVSVQVDTSLTSTTMYAMLHADLGTPGKLEYPGPDLPVEANGQMVNVPFLVTDPASGDVIINLSQDNPNTIHLVDGRGMSLYLSLKDSRGQSNCTGDCLKTWQPFFATGRIVAGVGVNVNNLGVLVLPDGRRQITYIGAPIYTYLKDTKPGDTNGQALDGTWFLVIP